MTLRSAIFSSAHPLNAEGPSRPLTKIAEAIRTAPNSDLNLILSPGDHAVFTEPERLGHAIGAAYDDLATWHMLHQNLHLSGFNVFLGGGGASLNQMRLLERASGSTCSRGTLWFSSWWNYARTVLAHEYAACGINATPIHPYVCWRAQTEQETSDFIIVPSRACRSTYPPEIRAKAHVCEFGVDTQKYQPRHPEDHTPGKPLRVIFPATNPYRKGLRFAIRAFQQFSPGELDVSLTGTTMQIPGDQIPVPIRSTGWINDEAMRALYQQSDVFLLPSLEEGQALASLEAMASGLPVIVTERVGLPITDHHQGIIIPASDPTAIHDALRYFVDNPNEVRRMGREARAWAETRPWSRFQTSILETLNLVTEGGAPEP